METDPGRWGHSLANLGEIWLPVLEAAGPSTVVEVGAYAGDVTRLVLDWAKESGAKVISIDPDPQESLVALAQANAELELRRATSLEAIPTLPEADAVIIDGDHNYYTVSQELRLIAERAGDAGLPLVICHDVGWPHARRDSYYNPESIPAEHRHETVEGGYVFPGETGLREGGLIYRWPAVRVGGQGNGVLTAIEDFLEGREDLHFALVPAFFGLGVIWERRAAYADELEAILAPWDRNPLLERLEANRVLHLASWQLEGIRAAWCGERLEPRNAILRELLESRAFALALAISRLAHRGEAPISRERIRRTLED
ncbi:MAG TPA: class I SAM-dependent methyltransferase [Solirubrobacteraceae bacterium]|nr:class I SAM-dependent methyltransferase [Solirubrobacteraceae bacterium]